MWFVIDKCVLIRGSGHLFGTTCAMEDQKKMLVDGEEIEEGSRNTADLANDGNNISPAIKSRSEGIPQATNDNSETNLSCNEEVEAEEEDEDDEEEEEEEEEEDLDYYYYSFAEEVNEDHSVNAEGQLNNNDDPEYFSYECLSPYEAEKFLQESVAVVTASVSVSFNSGDILRYLFQCTCINL